MKKRANIRTLSTFISIVSVGTVNAISLGIAAFVPVSGRPRHGQCKKQWFQRFDAREVGIKAVLESTNVALVGVGLLVLGFGRRKRY